MNRSIDVLFWNACPPASDLNPAQERCQNAPCMFIFSDEVLVIEIKGVYPIESLSRACQLSQTKVLFHVFFQCSSQFIQGFFLVPRSTATFRCLVSRSINVPARGQSGAMCDLGNPGNQGSIELFRQ